MTLSLTGYEFWAVMTPFLLALLAVGAMGLETLFWKGRPRALGTFILAGLLAIFVVQWRLHIYKLNMDLKPVLAFGGEYYFDIYSVFFNYIFLIAAAATAALSLTYWDRKDDARGEYYILLPFAAIGMCMMAAAHDLIILFVGLEVMSIAVYILVGSERARLKANEASLKYLLLGAFGSAILLYGMALLYGMTGEIQYQPLSEAIYSIFAARNSDPHYLTMMAGIAMILVGLAFKVAAVPFHMWTPDVYEGAPTPITAFMATGVKAAAFAGLVRLCITAFAPLWGLNTLYAVLYVLAVLTMTLGNFTAIAQRNLKRMLAYSSIAHAGYLLVGVTALVASGQFIFITETTGPETASLGLDLAKAHIFSSASSILFYLLAYSFMNLGAFGVMVALGRDRDAAETLDDFAGLSKTRPGLAAVMAICMLSLAGVPPLAGFAAKFYIFQSAVASRLYLLAIIGVLNSVVSAYFYLRVLVVMYMQPEPEPGKPLPSVTGAWLVNAIMATAVVGLGLFPQAILLILQKTFSENMINLPLH